MAVQTFLKSKNRTSLEGIRAYCRTGGVNVKDPVQMIPAREETVDEDTKMVTPAAPAIGEPDYWYTSVLFFLPIAPSGDIELCDEETGSALGLSWA